MCQRYNIGPCIIDLIGKLCYTSDLVGCCPNTTKPIVYAIQTHILNNL